MPVEVRGRSMAIGVGKALAFVAATHILLQLVVFTALGAVSARYWSQYDGRGLNEPWFLSSSVVTLGVVLLVCFAFLRYVDKRDWSYIRFRASGSLRLCAIGMVLSLGAVVLLVVILISADVVQLSISVDTPWRIVLYLLLALIGGFTLVVQEELRFRGYVLRTLEGSFSGQVAVVATSLLFGLFHLARPHASVLGILNIWLLSTFRGARA